MRIVLLLSALASSTCAWPQEPAASSSTQGAAPVTVRELVINPIAKDLYPAELVMAGVQGKTVVLALLKTDGTPESVSVQQTSRSAQLDEIALSIVKGLSFHPKDDAAGSPLQSVLVPVEFSKNTVASLTTMTCGDLNTDLSYFKATFPEKKPGDLKLFKVAVGAMFFTIEHERQLAFVKSINDVIATTIGTCVAEPQRKFFEVMKQATDDATAR